MTRTRIGIGLIVLGFCCMLFSGLWILHNDKREKEAGAAAGSIVEEIAAEKQRLAKGEARTKASDREEEEENGQSENRYPLSPQMEMPYVLVNGRAYIGTLMIPALELELPVARDFDMDAMEECPVVYSGSLYAGDCVICAHNYDTHFRDIGLLENGSLVSFEDVDNNVFSYRVIEIEYMNIDEAQRMRTGDWDLTLFTCVRGQMKRVAARLELLSVIRPDGGDITYCFSLEQDDQG